MMVASWIRILGQRIHLCLVTACPFRSRRATTAGDDRHRLVPYSQQIRQSIIELACLSRKVSMLPPIAFFSCWNISCRESRGEILSRPICSGDGHVKVFWGQSDQRITCSINLNSTKN
ncbi:unnamed protein product [Kuraishia capsulata CBS 1993]|uniref:Secreted protein n=1 Tax=Kuraishia capsulata CBS 1993 TaxID=1382522 RepID=W6MV48_9ASCO|nr:uncharacterized protein KUCA_T00002041001 [Kuraishia capsulata CBS 1993]CDK26070.1 unnamed protein product [Kuraishia capsulata CBS 1993]